MAVDNSSSHLLLNLRTQVVTLKSTGFWDRVTVPKLFPVAETALLLCDLWDDHWCRAAAKRTAAIAERGERGRRRGPGEGRPGHPQPFGHHGLLLVRS